MSSPLGSEENLVGVAWQPQRNIADVAPRTGEEPLRETPVCLVNPCSCHACCQCSWFQLESTLGRPALPALGSTICEVRSKGPGQVSQKSEPEGQSTGRTCPGPQTQASRKKHWGPFRASSCLLLGPELTS